MTDVRRSRTPDHQSAQGWEPRFDRDLAYGTQGELFCDELFAAIAEHRIRVEYKRKRNPDLELYLETEHDPGRRGRFIPSGLSTTEADVYVFLLADTRIFIGVPADVLHAALDRQIGRPISGAGSRGSCPTNGRLVPLDRLARFAAHEMKEPI